MNDIKSEMHDIGKLIDKKYTGIEHNFENYPGKIKDVPPIKINTIWEGILQHHCSKEFREYPKSFSTFVLSIADSVASATTRHEHIGKEPIFNVYKLWNPPSNMFHDLSEVIAVDGSDSEWISQIVEFINMNPTVEKFF
jgi:hypothetical protein